jgi:hypothetical protein
MYPPAFFMLRASTLCGHFLTFLGQAERDEQMRDEKRKAWKEETALKSSQVLFPSFAMFLLFLRHPAKPEKNIIDANTATNFSY